MALFTEQQIRNRYQDEFRRRNTRYFSASSVLNENRQSAEKKQEFDIFLSHSSSDDTLVAGLYLLLQDLGYTVYVDKEDPSLDRNSVTTETASILKERMKQSKCLIYAFSENASHSKWMPWELGYFDALKDSKIAVLPICQTAKYAYKGSEFVGLYYHVQLDKLAASNKDAIWIHDGDNYVNFNSWLTGSKPYNHNKV